jgi:hypothetical protein
LGGGVGGNATCVGEQSIVSRSGASEVEQPVPGAVGLGREYIAIGLGKRCVFGFGKLADGDVGLGNMTLTRSMFSGKSGNGQRGGVEDILMPENEKLELTKKHGT